jgi:hypothetical protein
MQPTRHFDRNRLRSQRSTCPPATAVCLSGIRHHRGDRRGPPTEFVDGQAAAARNSACMVRPTCRIRIYPLKSGTGPKRKAIEGLSRCGYRRRPRALTVLIYSKNWFRSPNVTCLRSPFMYLENSIWPSGRWSRNACARAAPPAFNAAMMCNDLRARVLATKNAFLVTPHVDIIKANNDHVISREPFGANDGH